MHHEAPVPDRQDSLPRMLVPDGCLHLQALGIRLEALLSWNTWPEFPERGGRSAAYHEYMVARS